MRRRAPSQPDAAVLVPPGDPAALREALLGLVALSEDERRAMGAAGRAFVETHRDVEGSVARLVELFGLQADERQR